MKSLMEWLELFSISFHSTFWWRAAGQQKLKKRMDLPPCGWFHAQSTSLNSWFAGLPLRSFHQFHSSWVSWLHLLFNCFVDCSSCFLSLAEPLAAGAAHNPPIQEKKAINPPPSIQSLHSQRRELDYGAVPASRLLNQFTFLFPFKKFIDFVTLIIAAGSTSWLKEEKWN